MSFAMTTLLQKMTEERAARTERLRLTVRAELRSALREILARLYNILEKILERICHGFENHFDKQGDYHERLIQRLALALPGIRPSFIPKNEVRAVRELKGFRISENGSKQSKGGLDAAVQTLATD